jgi:hypothetical protein
LTIHPKIPEGTQIKTYGPSELQGVQGTIGSATFNATDQYGRSLNSPE